MRTGAGAVAEKCGPWEAPREGRCPGCHPWWALGFRVFSRQVGAGLSRGGGGGAGGVKDSRRIGVGLRSWHRNGVIGGRGGQFRRTLKRRVIYLHNWGRLPTHKVFKVQHFLGDSLLQRQDDDAGSVTPKKKEEKNRRQTDPKDGLEFLDENLHEA